MVLAIKEEQYRQVQEAVLMHRKRLKDPRYAASFTASTSKSTGVEPAYVEKIVATVLAQKQPSAPVRIKLFRSLKHQLTPRNFLLVFIVIGAGYWSFMPLLNGLEQGPTSEKTSNIRAEHHMTSQIARVFGRLAPLKLMLTTYYQENEAFPTTLDELGFDAVKIPNDDLINDIHLDEKGQIRIQLKEIMGTSLEGSKLVIFLTPVLKRAWNGTQLDWNCTTTLNNAQLTYCQHDNMLVYKG